MSYYTPNTHNGKMVPTVHCKTLTLNKKKPIRDVFYIM